MLTILSIGMAQNFWTLAFVPDLMKTRLDFPQRDGAEPRTVFCVYFDPDKSYHQTSTSYACVPRNAFFLHLHERALFPLATDLFIVNILPCMSVCPLAGPLLMRLPQTPQVLISQLNQLHGEGQEQPSKVPCSPRPSVLHPDSFPAVTRQAWYVTPLAASPLGGGLPLSASRAFQR